MKEHSNVNSDDPYPLTYFISFDLVEISFLKPSLLAHILVNIKPPLAVDRYPLPRLLDRLPLQLSIHNLLLLPSLRHDASIRINDHTMPPRIIAGLHIPRRTTQCHIYLVIHRPSPGLQAPVQSAGSQIERAGVEQQESPTARSDGGEFREADVVAYRDGDFPIGGQVDQGEFVACREDL